MENSDGYEGAPELKLFEALSRDLKTILEDIEWRREDVYGEFKTLEQLVAREGDTDGDDIRAQEIVCDIAVKVLWEKEEEGKRLYEKWEELRQRLGIETEAAEGDEGGES